MDAAHAIQWSLGLAAAGSLVWVVISIRRTLETPLRYASGQVLPHRHMALVGVTFPLLVGAFFSARLFANPGSAASYGLCLNNVRQLSIGLQLYAEDADAAYPPAEQWRSASAAYVPTKSKTLDQCPSAHAAHAYAFNAALSGLSVGTVDDPSHTALVFESSIDWANASGGMSDIVKDGRHGKGRYGLGTCDGIANLAEKGETQAVVWAPKANIETLATNESPAN